MERKIHWLFYDTNITTPEDLQQMANYLQEQVDGLVLFIPKSFDIKVMNKKQTIENLQKMIDYVNEKWVDDEQ